MTLPKLEWEQTLKLNIFFLRVIGLWPKPCYKFDLYTAFTALMLTLQYSAFVPEGFKLYHNLKSNPVTVIEICVYASGQVLNCIKVTTFALCYDQARHLLGLLKSDLFQPQTVHQVTVMRSKMEFWQVMHKVCIGSVTVMATVWMLLPVFTGGYQKLALPVPAACPYCHIPAVYVGVYLLISGSVLSSVVAAFTVDLFVFAVFVSIEVQFELLGDSLQNLDLGFGQDVLRCIKHHQELIRFTLEANKLCDFIIFAQFFFSTLLLSFIGVETNMLEPGTFMFYSRISGVFIVITQLFIYCWFGNNIEDKSSRLLYAIFKSSWVKEAVPVKKILVLFSMNASPVQISAFKMFYMSLGVFVKLMKSAYSFLMLLRQFANDS